MHRQSAKTVGGTWQLTLLAALLVFAGCGGASSGNSATDPGAPSETSPIHFKSPGVRANRLIRSNVNCGAGSLWLPLKWGPVPPGTKELAVYIGRFKYVEAGGTRKLVVPFADLISHVNPSVRGIAANTIPEGAAWSHFGQNCLPVRRGQKILQEVFALDRTRPERPMKRGLAKRLTEEALAEGKAGAGPRSPGRLTEDAAGIGRFTAIYGP
jgi:hypothetical protein